MDIDRNRLQILRILVHHRNDPVWENNSSMDKWDRMDGVKVYQELDHKAVAC